MLRDLCAGKAAGGRRHRRYFRGPIGRRAPLHEPRELREPGRPIAAVGQGMPAPADNACRTAVDLSGLWTLRFGRGNWQDGVPDAVSIGVPGSWNDQLPGARDEFGPAWYERRFEAPPLAGREAAIRFGSVCYAAQVWLNGKWLGGHEGGHLPFAVPCTNALADGENVLVVRVDGQLGRDRVPPGLVRQLRPMAVFFTPTPPTTSFPTRHSPSNGTGHHAEGWHPGSAGGHGA